MRSRPSAKPDRRSSALFYAVRPMWWPRWLRRLFLLTLPLALPVWAAAAALLAFAAMLGLLSHPFRRFWGAPQRRSRSHSYFGYGAEWHAAE